MSLLITLARAERAEMPPLSLSPQSLCRTTTAAVNWCGSANGERPDFEVVD